MFRKTSTASKPRPASPPPLPADSTRPEASLSSASSASAASNLPHQTWRIDQELIAKGLSMLPMVLTPQDRLDFLSLIAQKKPNEEWLDFDEAGYWLGVHFRVFRETLQWESLYKWVFWTENALNTRLHELLASLHLEYRSFPDYQLRCVEGSKPILSGRTAPDQKKCVIAIDFGSTHSGFAFALTTPPQTVHIERIRNRDGSSLVDKQPTAALFDRHLNLVCFGNEARDFFMRSLAGDLLLNKFTQSGDNRFAEDYLYFDGDLKMRLWGDHAATTVEELEARTCTTLGGTGGAPLIDIVAKVLSHIKDQALEAVNRLVASQQSSTVTEDSQQQQKKITPAEVLWVLTVPAIWRESDKQFMRKASFKAGLIDEPFSSDMILALEPECAALAARYSDSNKINLEPKSKLLTFDCGGGTVDVCAIEILENDSVKNRFSCKQILIPTGGDWGGKKIDDLFYRFFQDFFGQAILERCSRVNPAALIELMEQWEKLKTSLSLEDFLSGTTTMESDDPNNNNNNNTRNKSSHLNEPPPPPQHQRSQGSISGAATTGNRGTRSGSLLGKRILGSFVSSAMNTAASVQGQTQGRPTGGGGPRPRKKTLDVSHVLVEAQEKLPALCKRYNAKISDPLMHVTCRSETMLGEPTLLRLPTKLLVSFFDPVLDAIVEHGRFLFRTFPDELKGLKQILLVGGVGTCPLLKFKFERAFPQMTILNSSRSSALVEFGAVKFGMQPSVFKSRKSKLTLGIKATVEYRPQMHRGRMYRENKYFDRAQKKHFIRNMFKPFLVAGEEVEQEKLVVHRFAPPSVETELVKFDIYTCDDRPPVDFITEEGCRLLARILVPVKKGDMTPLEVRLKIGFTEISAEVRRTDTDQVVLRRVLFEFNPAQLNQKKEDQGEDEDESRFEKSPIDDDAGLDDIDINVVGGILAGIKA